MKFLLFSFVHSFKISIINLFRILFPDIHQLNLHKFRCYLSVLPLVLITSKAFKMVLSVALITG